MFNFCCMFSFFHIGSTQDNFYIFANVFFHLCFSLLVHSPDLGPPSLCSSTPHPPSPQASAVTPGLSLSVLC